MKNVLVALGATNKFLRTYVPKIQQKQGEQDKILHDQEQRFPLIDDSLALLRDDAAQLTVACQNEQDKTRDMSKLLSALFDEYTEIEQNQKQMAQQVE